MVTRAFDDHRVTLVDAGDRDPVDAVRERLEQRELLGRERVGHAVQPGAGEDLHVLAVAAPQADPALAGHVAVAVHEQRRHARQDLVDPDAVALLHAEVGVGRELHDPADHLVARDDREHARVRDQLDALERGEIAPAEPAGLDAQHRATGRRVGNGELPHFIAFVPEEDDGSTGVRGAEYYRTCAWRAGDCTVPGVPCACHKPGPEALGFGGRDG